MRLNGTYGLMKTLVLLTSDPVVHMLFLIMNIVAIGEEEQDFFLFIWHTSQISFNQNLPPQKAAPRLYVPTSILYPC